MKGAHEERDSRRAVATGSTGRGRPPTLPARGELELVTERTGVLGYRYRRLRVELAGRRATVKEVRLQLDYDLQFELATKKKDLVRVRGRRIDGEELEKLWTSIARLRPLELGEHFAFLDSVDPSELDETIGADGEPIAVSTGEEGPATITLRFEDEDGQHMKRIVVDRFREPDLDAADARRARKAPLTALAALLDAGVRGRRGLNYRKADAFATLAEELASLKARDFLNLRQIESRAVEALGAIGDARAVRPLAEELFAPDARVRLQALDALASIGDASAVPDVELLYYDDETSVREKARRVLKALKTV